MTDDVIIHVTTTNISSAIVTTYNDFSWKFPCFYGNFRVFMEISMFLMEISTFILEKICVNIHISIYLSLVIILLLSFTFIIQVFLFLIYFYCVSLSAFHRRLHRHPMSPIDHKKFPLKFSTTEPEN